MNLPKGTQIYNKEYEKIIRKLQLENAYLKDAVNYYANPNSYQDNQPKTADIDHKGPGRLARGILSILPK